MRELAIRIIKRIFTKKNSLDIPILKDLIIRFFRTLKTFQTSYIHSSIEGDSNHYLEALTTRKGRFFY